MTALFPECEIYASLLPAEARRLIGTVGPETEPAKAMLERLGFAYCGHVDPFDGGPYLEANVADIPIVAATRRAPVAELDGAHGDHNGFVSFHGDAGFRAVRTDFTQDGDGIAISAEALASLGAEPGATVGVTPMRHPAAPGHERDGGAGRDMTELLRHPPGNWIDGQPVATPGDAIRSFDPADPERLIWSASPEPAHVHDAVSAARAALPAWAARSLDERVDALRSWQSVARGNAGRLADLICDEMGKTMGEARFEANAIAGKVDITLDRISLSRVTDYEVAVNETRSGACHFRPHGVMAVIGPFNFPAHLPNGQFVPALLMGNTVVFKPSEKTPAVGQLLGELMHEALTAVDAPSGVFNVVQGGGDVAADLVGHDGIDGILFTGSWPVGRRILEANLDRPGRIVALEMGGNNPAVVMDDASFDQAVIECARGAFATTGQRCTCTRRIIVQSGIADRFIPALGRVASTLLVGPGRSDEPVFMGPLVTDDARQAVLDAQARLGSGGGRLLVPCSPLDRPGNFLTAGVIEVDRFDLGDDCEVFGPLVQVSIVDDLEGAIEQANATRFGLAASIFTASEDAFAAFRTGVRAGCINHNTGTAGASSKLPFGGLGISGNHRPAAAFAADFCAYPLASMVETSTGAAVPAGMLGPEHWSDEPAAT